MAESGSLKARIRISRNSPADIGIRGLEVRLDGELAANLGFGKSVELEVEPGKHEIVATNSLYKRKDRLELQAGETAEYEVSNVVTGLGKLLIAVGGGLYRVELKRTA